MDDIAAFREKLNKRKRQVETESLLEEQLSEEFGAFLQVAVKEAVVTLFEPINKLLDGEVSAKPSGLVVDDCSLESIMESFSSIKKSLANLEIPDEVMEELKKEFLDTNIDGKLYVNDTNYMNKMDEPKKETKKKFKLPQEKLLPRILSSSSTGLKSVSSDSSSSIGLQLVSSDNSSSNGLKSLSLEHLSSSGLKSVSSDNSTGLKVVSSDRSSSSCLKSTSSATSSTTGLKATLAKKPVTMYTCPLVPCRFTIGITFIIAIIIVIIIISIAVIIIINIINIALQVHPDQG